MKCKFAVMIFFIAVISGCSLNSEEGVTIKIKGSDTMLYLVKNLAAEYMKHNHGIYISVEGGGTALGIKALINDEAEIAAASRNLKPEEVKMLSEKFNSIGMSFLIAKDGLTVFLNPGNKIRDITLSDLKKIYTGKITNWKVLNGDDAEIYLITRSPNSGTYLYFKEHILEGEEYSPAAIVKATTEAIVDEVLKNKYAVGYGGIGYSRDSVSAKINSIEATEKNIISGNYPISRYLHFITPNVPRGLTKNFIDWTISPDGQKIIRNSGYIPIW